MIQGWAVIGTAFVYLLTLFAVASYGDRRRKRGEAIASRPNIYAFSLAIYCTTWTFFGSVGLAASSGLSFLAIYVGPIALMLFGFPLVTRVVRLSKDQRITSVADFLGARYGKSGVVAAVATIIAVVGTIPYIALQLKAVSTSVSTLISHYNPQQSGEFGALGEISILIAITLAIFTILFGTRHADATEHQDGLMLAVALESVVKIAAFLLVGIYVTFFVFNGFGDLARQAAANPDIQETLSKGFDPGNFAVLTLLSLLVFLLLPRQFHVTVVENHSQDELNRARWLFPLYLVSINLFVIPIAVAGLITFGRSVRADDFVLLLPMSQGNDLVSMFTFLGGLSAGAAMVVVACVALAIMISNNLVLPLILRSQAAGRPIAAGNMEQTILKIRRTAIMVLLFLGYAYYRTADNTQALASIGLVAFAATAQLAPSFFGGLFWSGANSRGAIAGMTSGLVIWAYTLLLPTFLDPAHWLVAQGPLSSGMLKPSALFYFELSPLTHGVLWSLSINTIAFIIGSLSRQATNSEQAQAAIFATSPQPLAFTRRSNASKVKVAQLLDTVSLYLGSRRSERAFEAYWSELGKRPKESDPVDAQLLQFSEQLLASAIGSSSSRLVHTLLLKRNEVASQASKKLLDEATEALRYNRDVLQTALDQLDQGISVFDGEFRLAFWNRRFRRLLSLPQSVGQAGVSLNEVARQIVRAHSLQEQKIDSSDLADRILHADEPWLLALNASERIVEIRSAPMPGGGIVVTWHDITDRILVAEALREANETLERRVEERTSELVKANQQLERATRAADQANASKTRFLAAAGHDILQPLNAARLYTTTLFERLENGRDEGLVHNIGKSLESVEEILGAILAISRLDTGKQETKPVAYPVQRLFEQMEIDFAPVAREKALSLKFVRTSAWIRSDPALLRRLLQNLISNAIKYTPSGKVLVGCRRRGNQVRIEILDTGIGIAESDQRSIFTEFRRLQAGARQAPGLGLGLSIVERISQVLNHSVSLHSVPGKGTRFAVTVPRASAQAETNASRREGSRAAMLQVEGLLVLCIDNDPSILQGMAGLLGQWGCSVHTALDQEGALAAIAELGRAPDIVLADYHLESATGIDAIDAIRERHGAGIPCVLVTADRSPSLKSEADGRGIAMLHKPVKPAGLRSVLALGQTRRQRAAE
jgi:Na+/proline symporter/signal transduction histidine kinase/ActR/RegA family two-component response regulator